jgi:CBS domain-containing protein
LRLDGGNVVQISEILKRKGSAVVTIGQEETVAAAVAEMARSNVGALVVSRDGRAVEGIVSERDVARALDSLGGALLDEPVLTIMTSEVRAVSPDDEVEALAVIMTEHRMRHVPVLQGEALVGIVSIGDVVKSRIEELEQDREALFRYIEAR